MRFPRVIYIIVHNDTGRMYIGSTYNFEQRIKSHLYTLRCGHHAIKDMQDDFNKYGENYTIKILGNINNIHEKYKEYDAMSKYHSYIRGIGYNYQDHKFTNRDNRFFKNKQKLETMGLKKVTLSAARKIAGFTQDELGDEIGVSQATVYKWEKGILDPSVNQAMKIASVLGFNYDDIVFLPQ